MEMRQLGKYVLAIMAVVAFPCRFSLQAAQPHPLMAEYDRAWQLTGQLRAGEAIPLLKAIIAKDRTFYRAYEVLAEAYWVEKQPEEAESFLRSLAADDPRNPFAYYGLGQLRDLGAVPGAAAEFYKRCIHTDPLAYVCYRRLIEESKTPVDAVAMIPMNAEANPYALLAMAELRHFQRKLFESNQVAEKGLEAARKSDSLDLLFLFEDLLGANYQFLGKFPEGIQHCTEALRLSRMLGDRKNEFGSLQALNRAYRSAGDIPHAITVTEDALALARELGHRRLEAEQIADLGLLSRINGDRDRALDYYRQAKTTLDEINLPGKSLSVLLTIADIHYEAGDFHDAAQYFDECRILARNLGNQWFEAFAMTSLANAHRELGEYFQALALQSEAIRTFEALGRKLNVGATLRDAGAVYAAMGAYPEAQRRYTVSLQRARESFDVEGQQRNLLNLADLALRRERPMEVLRYVREERALGEHQNYASFRCRALLKRGSAYLMLRQTRRALQDWDKGLGIARMFHLQSEEAAVLAAEGRGYLKLGDLLQAGTQLSASLDLAEQIGLAQLVPEIRRALAEVNRRAGNFAEAFDQLRLAVNGVESLRARIPAPELRADFVQENWKVYEDTIDLLSVRGKRGREHSEDRLAFEYAERARARSFLDLLAESKARITRGLNAEQLARQGGLFAKLSQASAALIRHPSTENRRAVENAERSLADWALELRRTNPQYQRIQYPEPYRVEQTQQVVGQAGPYCSNIGSATGGHLSGPLAPTPSRWRSFPAAARSNCKVRSLRAMIGHRPSSASELESYQSAASAL